MLMTGEAVFAQQTSRHGLVGDQYGVYETFQRQARDGRTLTMRHCLPDRLPPGSNIGRRNLEAGHCRTRIF